jgi:signal transduction histidine kinase
VEVLVLDEGIGLDPETAELLFQPFFRSQAAREKAAGIGIGLTVCRRIVESLGGRIWASPSPNGGAAVGFALPVALAETEAEAAS